MLYSKEGSCILRQFRLSPSQTDKLTSSSSQWWWCLKARTRCPLGKRNRDPESNEKLLKRPEVSIKWVQVHRSFQNRHVSKSAAVLIEFWRAFDIIINTFLENVSWYSICYVFRARTFLRTHYIYSGSSRVKSLSCLVAVGDISHPKFFTLFFSVFTWMTFSTLGWHVYCLSLVFEMMALDHLCKTLF